MPAAFSHTLRSLDADRPRVSVAALLLSLGALLGWSAWAVQGRLTVYAVTDKARIEVQQRAFGVDAPIAGRVARADLVIGREVQAGDVIVEIDSELEKRQLEQLRARVASIGPQIEALQREVTAQTQVLGNQERATLAALDENAARVQEAALAADLADRQAKRAALLVEQGLMSAADGESAQAAAEQKRSELAALQKGLGRVEREQRTRGSENLVRTEQLRRELAGLEGDRTTALADVRVLEQTIERSLVRAPVSGRVGEAAIVNAGTYVKPGDRLLSVIPPGELRAVADYVPADALGRIQPGQQARLRLEGFPWMQYGVVPATVTGVGSELRDGRVRVELAIHPDPSSSIPLQHGLPGTAEIDVERVAPIRLVLRTIGARLGEAAGGGAGT
jgi:membrane fusion protein (multidrug efflux system)